MRRKVGRGFFTVCLPFKEIACMISVLACKYFLHVAVLKQVGMDAQRELIFSVEEDILIYAIVLRLLLLCFCALSGQSGDVFMVCILLFFLGLQRTSQCGFRAVLFSRIALILFWIVMACVGYTFIYICLLQDVLFWKSLMASPEIVECWSFLELVMLLICLSVYAS